MSKARDIADLGAVTSRLDTVGASDGALSNRNLIINGAMQVAQRGTSGTSAGTGTENYLSVDRWAINSDGSGSQLSVDVSSDAPDGFSKSLYISPDAAVPTPSGGNRLILKHKIEGQNLTQWAYATASAKPLTLSFWVKSNVTGNVGIVLNTTEICGQTYSIDLSNTWEYKSITFPASATGTLISYDNTVGLSLDMWLTASPVFQGTYAGDGVWTTNVVTSYTQASNINLYSSTSNYFQITGVQLEVGDTATPFEHRSYGDELARCQRYYQTINSASGMSASTTLAQFNVPFPVEMRTTPTASISDASGVTCARITDHYFTDTTITSGAFITLSNSSSSGVRAQIGSFSGLTQGRFVGFLPSGSYSSFMRFDAEL